jgi:hypothetical protein
MLIHPPKYRTVRFKLITLCKLLKNPHHWANYCALPDVDSIASWLQMESTNMHTPNKSINMKVQEHHLQNILLFAKK